MRKVTPAGEPFLSAVDQPLYPSLGTCGCDRADGFSPHRGGRAAFAAETGESHSLFDRNTKRLGPASLTKAKTGLRGVRDSGICLCASSLAIASQVAEILPGARNRVVFDRGDHPGGNPDGRSDLSANRRPIPRPGVGESGREAGLHLSQNTSQRRGLQSRRDRALDSPQSTALLRSGQVRRDTRQRCNFASARSWPSGR